MIAMALVNDPDLLIADEPTTALDVTTQAQILDLMDRLQQEFGSAIIMITHDLGVVAEIADDVVVMYAAKVVEQASVDDLFKQPRHPYTWGLLGSLPRLDADVDRLVQIPGQPPSLLTRRRAAASTPRCAYVLDRCKAEQPELEPVPGDVEHLQACFLDDATKERENERLRAGILGGTVVDGRGAARRRGSEEALPGHARDHLPEAGRLREGRGRRLLHGQPRRDARRRRRVRAAASRRWRAASCACSIPTGGKIVFDGQRHHEHQPAGDAPDPARDDDDLPGSLRVAEPAQAGRLHHRRGARGPQDRLRHRDQAARAGAARDRRPQPRALQPLPARVLRAASASASASRARSRSTRS